MKTRRTFITAAALTAVAAPLTRAASQTSGEDAKKADFLFVQTANGITFDKSTNKLTLDGVSPITVFFSAHLSEGGHEARAARRDGVAQKERWDAIAAVRR
jgi:hypothetical protein